METHLWACVWVVPKDLTEEGHLTQHVGSTILLAGVPDWTTSEGSQYQLSVSQLPVWVCNVTRCLMLLPQCLPYHDRPCSYAANQNKLFLSCLPLSGIMLQQGEKQPTPRRTEWENMSNRESPLPSGTKQNRPSLQEFTTRKVDFIHSWSIYGFGFALGLFMGILREIKSPVVVRNERRVSLAADSGLESICSLTK